MSQQYISFQQGRDRQRKVRSIVTMSESDRPTCALPKPPTPILVCFGVIMGIMSFAQIVIGAMYRFDCPRQYFIFLLANGVICLLLTTFFNPPCSATRFGKKNKGWACLFHFCWLIVGNVWIYAIYKRNYNETTTSCNMEIQLALWTMNLNYITFRFQMFFCRDRYNPVNV